MLCWVNPAGVRLNDGLLGRIPHVRASVDMGPWMRWTLIGAVRSKYTLLIDDDCTPGNGWLRAAIARLESAEATGDPIVVAAAGSVMQGDSDGQRLPIGPESLQRQETTVDLGRGAWLMPTELAHIIAIFPQIGSPLATAIHVAAASQHEGVATVVLPYPHNQREVWGMLSTAQEQGSLSGNFDRLAQQGNGPNAAAMRTADYDVYRHVGWEPMCVMEDDADDPPEDVDDSNTKGVGSTHGDSD